MASREINEEKRRETAALIERVTAEGWSVADLQAMFGVTRSCIGGWRKGRNMAPNHTRDTLRSLQPRATKKGREAFAAKLKARAAWHRKRASEDRAFADKIEASDPERAQHVRKTAATLDRDAGDLETMAAQVLRDGSDGPPELKRLLSF